MLEADARVWITSNSQVCTRTSLAMPDAAPRKARRSYRPGEVVQISGVYAVQHHDHRPEHNAMLLQSEILPACRACKDAVRFTLSKDAAHFSEDRHFAHRRSLKAERPRQVA